MAAAADTKGKEKVQRSGKRRRGDDEESALSPREKVAALTGETLLYADSVPKQWNWNKWLRDDEKRTKVLGQMYLLVGKTQTGKSWFVRDMLYSMRRLIPFGWIFSHTKHNNFWRQYFPNALIHERYSDQVMEAILELQRGRSQHHGVNRNVVVLLDDVASEALRYQDRLTELAMEGRHYGITTIVTTQHFTKATTAMRANAWWTIVFTTTHKPTLEYMNEEWMGHDFADKYHLFAFIEKNTKDHQALMILQDPYAPKEDRYYTYKARDLDKKTFALLNDRAWGGPRAQMAAAQRRKYPLPKKYSESYLKQLYAKSRIRFGDLVKKKDDQSDPFRVVDEIPIDQRGEADRAEAAPPPPESFGPFGRVEHPIEPADLDARGRTQWVRALATNPVNPWIERGAYGAEPADWQRRVGVHHRTILGPQERQ